MILRDGYLTLKDETHVLQPYIKRKIGDIKVRTVKKDTRKYDI